MAEGEITGRCGSSVVHAGKCLFLPCSSSVFKSLPLLHRHGLAGRSFYQGHCVSVFKAGGLVAELT